MSWWIFPALQPMPIARSGAPLRLVGSLRMVLLNFWILVGLALTSRAILFFKVDQGG